MGVNDSTNLGFALVGVGNIGDFHARAIAETNGAKLISVFSRSADKTKLFAEKYNVEPAESLDSLLARKDVDVVCVTTPSGNHSEIVLPALRAGKHVLCEKPLEINLDRIDEMVEEAKKQKRILS